MRLATVRRDGGECLAAAEGTGYGRLDASGDLTALLRAGVHPRQLPLGEPVDGELGAPLRPGKDRRDRAQLPRPHPRVEPRASGAAARVRVNGEVMQESSTAEMVFGVAELLAFCSHSFTLEPGDVVLTGTPWGSGEFMDPPRSLAAGDVSSPRSRGSARFEIP